LTKINRRIGYNYSSMRRKLLIMLLVFTVSLVLAAIPRGSVKAVDAVTAYDLIALVNGIRTGTYGLPALVEDPILDSVAQWTADEMASIDANNHLYYLGYPGVTERAANFGFGGGKTVFVTENYYKGNYASLSDITVTWSDADHMLPMVKPSYAYVGAATSTDAAGTTYYVLVAGYIAGESVAVTSSSTGNTPVTTTNSAATSNWIGVVTTSTPSADGMIYHVVQSNQFLSDIAAAYGVTVDYLVTQNNLTSADAIYVGQTLVIKPAPTATITPTLTPTEIYPTGTPTLAMTPTPAYTRTPTPRPSLLQSLPEFDRGTFGLLLVIVSAIGLVAVVMINFIKVPKKPAAPVNPEPVKEPEKAPQKKPMIKPAGKSLSEQTHKPMEIPIKTSKKTTKK
jgi:LysM repeat protein